MRDERTTPAALPPPTRAVALALANAALSEIVHSGSQLEVGKLFCFEPIVCNDPANSQPRQTSDRAAKQSSLRPHDDAVPVAKAPGLGGARSNLSTS